MSRKNKHFSRFSQNTSHQAPWHPSQKLRLIMAVSLDKVSSRYDQMAPQLCPFEISSLTFFDHSEKTSNGTMGITDRRKGNLELRLFLSFLGDALKEFFRFQMGITGAPFGRIGMKICPTTPPWRALARGEGAMGPGGWGAGKKLKIVPFLGHFFWTFEKQWKNNNEIGQICSDWALIDSPWLPASSFRLPGICLPLFLKIWENNVFPKK